jgi:hypothetical protein
MMRALLIGASTRERLGVNADLDLIEAVLRDYEFTEIVRCPRPATRETMLCALSDLAARTTVDDTVVIYYSGHGGIARFSGAVGGISEPLRDWRYLVPEDPGHSARNHRFRGVLDVELGFIIDQRLASKCPNVTIILECCFAGGMVALPPSGCDPSTRGNTYYREFDVPEFLGERQAWGSPWSRGFANAGPQPVIIAATSEARVSYESPGAVTNGCFTKELAAALRRVRGRRTTWGRLIDGVRRSVQLSGNMLYQEPHVIGPRGREVFGTSTCDDSREFEVMIGSDSRLCLLAGQVHALRTGDLLELIEPDEDVSFGCARVREAGLVRSRLEWVGDTPTNCQPRSLVAVLRARARPARVRLFGDTPTMQELRAAIRVSPWLTEIDHVDPTALEVHIDQGRLRIAGPGAAREPWPQQPRVDLATGLDTPVTWVIADLEALARTRGFVSACAKAPAPPDYVEFWLRAHGRDGERVIDGDGGLVHCDDRIEAGMKYAMRYTGETMFVNLINLGVDGRLHSYDDKLNIRTRGGFDLRSEEPGDARGVERSVCLTWPAEVPPTPTRESLFFVLTSAKVDLEPLTQIDPKPRRKPNTRACERDILDKLFDPVESYVRRIDFTLVP